MSKLSKKLRNKQKLEAKPTTDPIKERADELFKNKGGNVLLRNVNLMHKTLLIHESQIDKLYEGEEIELLLSPFVAMRYLREIERVNEKILALQDECLELARVEQKPEPVATEREQLETTKSVAAQVESKPDNPKQPTEVDSQAPPAAA
ncbi:MAG: hypothetical protein L3J82_00340 [Planctomycetes bacterium]|nr:hypothetical protein [Planctomycetota bacterium]